MMGKTRRRRSSLAAAAILALSVSAAAAGDPWEERTPELGMRSEMPKGKLGREELEALTRQGEALFRAKFTTLDGVGRPSATQAIVPTLRKHVPQNAFSRTAGLDAGSCFACHNDPVVGGAGDFVANVFASEGFESADFDSLDPQFSNERATPHLFGAGLVELLAREMSHDLQAIRTEALKKARADGATVRLPLSSKGVEFGFITAEPDGSVGLDELDGIDTDLVIRPFTAKGVMTSLRQFTVNALNQHSGLQAGERFGARWTGTDDHDQDGMEREVNAADVSAMVAWQATRPLPLTKVPENGAWREAAAKGEAIFEQIGCASCHRPALPLESLGFADPGPYDVSGTLNDAQVEKAALYDIALLEWAGTLERDEEGRYLVPLYGDLKRHAMTDRQIDALGNELLSQRFVDRNVFITARLWGVGSTAPYGHRNDFTTLDEIILAHGGDARGPRDTYETCSPEEKSVLIAFLKTLVIEP